MDYVSLLYIIIRVSRYGNKLHLDHLLLMR